MTMAAVMESRAGTQAWPEASRIACVELAGSMREAEAVWRGLEQSSQLSTPYQRFDFLSAWQRQVGTREGIRPFIVIAYDREHRPLLLLPLGVRRENGARVARFLGGKHATFNMALWDKDLAATATAADLDALISMIRAHAQADVLALTQQPRRWTDIPNPFALLPSQVSANDCPLLAMAPGSPPASRVSNSFRRRLKGKERKLQSLPGYGYRLATSDADIKRLLDWFFTMKPQRMAANTLGSFCSAIRCGLMTKNQSSSRLMSASDVAMWER